MEADVFEFNGMGLRINPESLVYLSGTDSQAMWDARGLSGHTQDKEKLAVCEKEKEDAVHRLMNTPDGQRKIQDYAAECREVMRAILLGNAAWLKDYLGNRQFVLLCGLHRTGGTYILDELSRIYDFPYQKYHCMHDDLPSFFPVMYWKWPIYTMQYYAEVAQFLVIVRRSVRQEVVIKKRAIWTFAIESLMHIFGDRLIIYLHARHPITWAWADTDLRDGKERKEDVTAAGSMQQYVDVYDGTLKGNENAMQVMIRFWELFHKESARKGANMHVFPFGEAGSKLSGIAEAVKPGYTPESFNPTARDYGRFAAHFDEAQQAIDNVREHWDRCGLSFPNLELL